MIGPRSLVLIAALTAGCQLGLDGAACPCATGWSCCLGEDRCVRDLAACPGFAGADADPGGPARTPVAPDGRNAMYQGGQQRFLTAARRPCIGRVAASMARRGFCFLTAGDDVVCAGQIGGVDYGPEFTRTGQTQATQIMVMSADDGMCVARTDHTVQCMGSNTRALGASARSPAFQPWTAQRHPGDRRRDLGSALRDLAARPGVLRRGGLREPPGGDRQRRTERRMGGFRRASAPE